MENLVIIQEEKALTTSMKVAEAFEKLHKNVLQAIENLECSQKFRELNFQPSSYTTLQNKELPMYYITRQGFTMLAMGFNGKRATEFKEAYIEAFDLMESHIREMQKTILTNDELALVFNLLNFFRYLEHCKQVEEKHKKIYIASRLNEGKDYGELAKQFYVMCNNLLDIGNTKQLQAKYKQYCTIHPNIRYAPNADKFVMIFSMDKHEPIRHAIADFLKLELHTDGYTLKLANQAKDLAKRGGVKLELRNETNLFQDKDETLIDMSKLKYLASALLEVGA
jgi:Rha family phage regulatory protein